MLRHIKESPSLSITGTCLSLLKYTVRTHLLVHSAFSSLFSVKGWIRTDSQFREKQEDARRTAKRSTDLTQVDTSGLKQHQ